METGEGKLIDFRGKMTGMERMVHEVKDLGYSLDGSLVQYQGYGRSSDRRMAHIIDISTHR